MHCCVSKKQTGGFCFPFQISKSIASQCEKSTMLYRYMCVVQTWARYRLYHRLNLELDLQSLFGLLVYSCTQWLRPWISPLPPSFGLIYEATIDQPRYTTSLCNPLIWSITVWCVATQTTMQWSLDAVHISSKNENKGSKEMKSNMHLAAPL